MRARAKLVAFQKHSDADELGGGNRGVGSGMTSERMKERKRGGESAPPSKNERAYTSRESIHLD